MRLPPHITEEIYNKFEKCYLYMVLANVKHTLTSTTRFSPKWDSIIEETMGIDVKKLGIDADDMQMIADTINDQLSCIQAEIMRQEYL